MEYMYNVVVGTERIFVLLLVFTQGSGEIQQLYRSEFKADLSCRLINYQTFESLKRT